MNPFDTAYPVVLLQDVIWGDMDAFGHVNNTVYFRYFEDARIAYFELIGVQEQMKRDGIGPILASTHCNFRLPLDYPDRIHVGTRSTVLSPRRFNMEYAVFSEKHEAITAEGEGLIVYYDYTHGRSIDIPDEIAAGIAKLEN